MARKKENISVTEQSGIVVDGTKKKKKKGGLGKVLLILIIFLLIAALIVAFIFDLFSLRQSFVDLVMDMDRGYVQETLQTAEEEKAKAQEAQTLADNAKTQYENKLTDLDSRENALNEAEINLAALDKEVKNGQTPAERREALISLFETMDRASAAQTLQNLGDVGTVAGILSEMKKKAAAEIMDQFSVEYRSAVAQAML